METGRQDVVGNGGASRILERRAYEWTFIVSVFRAPHFEVLFSYCSIKFPRLGLKAQAFYKIHVMVPGLSLSCPLRWAITYNSGKIIKDER